jgi:hypothetical protein
MKLVLPMLAQSYQLHLAPGHPVIPESAISLRPKHGMLMTIEAVR